MVVHVFFHQSKVGSSMLFLHHRPPRSACKELCCLIGEQEAAEAGASGLGSIHVPASRRRVLIHTNSTPEAAIASCRRAQLQTAKRTRHPAASRRRLVHGDHVIQWRRRPQLRFCLVAAELRSQQLRQAQARSIAQQCTFAASRCKTAMAAAQPTTTESTGGLLRCHELARHQSEQERACFGHQV